MLKFLGKKIAELFQMSLLSNIKSVLIWQQVFKKILTGYLCYGFVLRELLFRAQPSKAKIAGTKAI